MSTGTGARAAQAPRSSAAARAVPPVLHLGATDDALQHAVTAPAGGGTTAGAMEQEQEQGPEEMDSETLQKETRALSFNPFGDEVVGSVGSSSSSSSSSANDRNPALDEKSAATEEDDIQATTRSLALLEIPSPAGSTALGRSGTPLHSASSGSTSASAASLLASSGGEGTGSTSSASTSSLFEQQRPPSPPPLFSTQSNNAPLTQAEYLASSSLSGKLSSSSSHPLGSRSPSVSLSIGSGQAPVGHGSVPAAVAAAAIAGSTAERRPRLYSGSSSARSTHSRRSTRSSLSSVNSRHVSHGADGPEPDVTQVAAGAPLGHAELPPNAYGVPVQSAAAGSNPTLLNRKASQDSVISLQPSMLSLETAAKSPPPVAGYRIPASGSLHHSSFPVLSMCGPAFKDVRNDPIYVCSAILGTAIHPGKAGPHLKPPVRISFAGKEILHDGRFDLLPITPDMKWVDAKDGIVPEGREPIQGGYEESGEQLHHALARIDKFWVPGKTGKHLKGANFPFAGTEIRLRDGYKVLCWRTASDARSTTLGVADTHDNDVTPQPPA